MAFKKFVLVFFLLIALIVVATKPTSHAEARRERVQQTQSCKYVGGCSSQAQCAYMCSSAGIQPRTLYCDFHMEGGSQCCCVPS